MIFQSIIAIVLGVSTVTMWLIVGSKAGPWVGGAAAALFALVAGPRLTRNDAPTVRRIILAIVTLLPVWILPLFTIRDESYRQSLPVLIAITLALAVGILLTSRRIQQWLRRVMGR